MRVYAPFPRLAISLVVALASASAHAQNDKDEPPAAVDDDKASKKQKLERLKAKIDAASTEVDALLATPQASDDERITAMEDDLAALNERLDVIEDDIDQIIGIQDQTASDASADRLDWFGDYRVIVNNIGFIDRPASDDAAADYDEQRSFHPNLWSHRLRLGMTFDLGDSVRFYGRLVFFKNFGELNEKPIFFDSSTTRFPRDTVLRLERAYIDWFITDWLVFTAGRVTAPEGPPAELKENTERSATWGVHMVEAEFETLMLTLHLAQLLEDTYFRVFYFPFSSVLDVDPFDQNSLFLDIGIDPMHAMGVLYEMRVPFLGKNLLQLGAVYVPQFKPRYLPIDGVLPSGPFPDTLGWLAQGSALFEWLDILGYGVDAFAAYTYTFLMPTNDRVRYDLGDGVILPVGLASYDDPDQNQAHLFYAGTRYSTPFFASFSPKLGVEVNYGTKYHILFGSPSDLRVNKLGTRGLGLEGYYIQPLVPDRLFFRVGALQLVRQYEGSFIGPAIAVDQRVTNFYALLHAQW